jgi:hypothetical protein
MLGNLSAQSQPLVISLLHSYEVSIRLGFLIEGT